MKHFLTCCIEVAAGLIVTLLVGYIVNKIFKKLWMVAVVWVIYMAVYFRIRELYELNYFVRQLGFNIGIGIIIFARDKINAFLDQ